MQRHLRYAVALVAFSLHCGNSVPKKGAENKSTTSENNGTTNSATNNDGVLAFDDGVYLLVAEFNDPIPAIISLAADIQVDDDGRIALVGAECDEIDGAAKTTRNPEEVEIDASDAGYIVHLTGDLVVVEDGGRQFETNAYNLSFPIGPLTYEFEEFRIVAAVKTNPDTGKDTIEGTVTFTGTTLTSADGTSSQTGPGSGAIAGDWVDPSLEPAGTPKVCGDVCGVSGGICAPAADWPGDGACR